jgi:hypothetical protein
MTVKITTKLRNKLLSERAAVNKLMFGIDLSFTTSTIAQVAALMVGFSAGDKLTCKSTSGTNDTTARVLTVAAGTLTFADDTFSVESAATAGTVALASARGGCFADLFRHGRLCVYSGTVPTDVDAAIAGILLCEYTVGAGTFVVGTDTYGINFDVAASGVLSKDTTETWQGVGTTAAGVGTAGNYWVLYGNDGTPAGLGTDQEKIMGLIGTSGASFTSGITTWVSGTTYTMETAQIPMPAY